MVDESVPPRNTFEKFVRSAFHVVDGPVTWFRESVVEPRRKKYPYYHRHFPRVPNIDECYEGDPACFYEADMQFKRDRKVDSEIINILRNRVEDCYVYEAPDNKTKCKKLLEDYEQAAENYFIKYGDLGFHGTVVDAFMKQKHRLIWERQHPKTELQE